VVLRRRDSFRERKSFLATKDEHLRKAEENQAFAESITNSDVAQREWGLIIRFYAAIHYVEAYLSSVGCGTVSHRERRRVIASRSELAPLADDFQDLYNLAWNARYLCLPCPTAEVIKAHQLLLSIRAHIRLLS
jgi:hypothetical protein